MSPTLRLVAGSPLLRSPTPQVHASTAFPAAEMIVPREHETPFNKAPVVRAVSALLMIITILSALTRLITRQLTVGSLKSDDVLVAVATTVSIAQSIAVIVQGANGLGKIKGDLSPDQISAILKSQYASDALFILVLLLAKVSATRTIWGMAPREKRWIIKTTEALIGIWAVSAMLTSFFQCSLPEPWDYLHGKCFNRGVFWIYVDALNIVTDLAITAILFEMFIKLKTSLSKKILVIGVFGCRVFIIPPIVFHMIHIQRTVSSTDPLFDSWSSSLITQVIECMSVMATCIPYLKPFLDSLESGQMNPDVLGTKTKSSNSRSRSGGQYASGHTNSRAPRKGITSITTLASNASHRLQKYEMMSLDKSVDRGSKKGNTAIVTTSKSKGSGSWDGQSHTSQTVLVQQSWRVDVEKKDNDLDKGRSGTNSPTRATAS